MSLSEAVLVTLILILSIGNIIVTAKWDSALCRLEVATTAIERRQDEIDNYNDIESIEGQLAEDLLTLRMDFGKTVEAFHVREMELLAEIAALKLINGGVKLDARIPDEESL